MKQKDEKVIMRVLGGLGVFLLFASLAFEALPLLPNGTLNTFHLAARQRVLEEHIVKNVLILAYRPQDEHTEAISEIQTALPVWEEVENGLQNGDASLGISSHMPQDIKLMLLQAQPDFVYLDTSARHILAHPSPVDPVQISIVLQHDQGYYIAMGQAVNVLQDDLSRMTVTYFWIELSMSMLLMIIWISFIFSANSALSKKESKA